MTDPFAYTAPGLIKTVRGTATKSGITHAFAGQSFIPPLGIQTRCSRTLRTATALVENRTPGEVSCHQCRKAIQPYYGTSSAVRA